MAPDVLERASDLLAGASTDSVSSWADDYRHDHPGTGPWHYIEVGNRCMKTMKRSRISV
jgi:hypothetical protein